MPDVLGLSTLSVCRQGGGGLAARPKRNKKTSDQVHLVLIGDDSGRRFIGVHAVPDRLPEMLRYPGESAAGFSARVLHCVSGAGALWAKLMYDGDVAWTHPPPIWVLLPTPEYG